MTDEPRPTGRVVIAGGSGFLGMNLGRCLAISGCEVVILSRNPSTHVQPLRQVCWDGRTPGCWARELDGASALVNLAGRTVDCIKTPDHCDEILRSRVEATLALGKAVRTLDRPPPVWVQMGTAHRYGDPPEALCDESSTFGYGLAPFVAEAWEKAYEEAKLPQMRGVVLRTSFVLGKNGGALPRLTKLARWGLGGTVGHGKQGMSWLHERDMNRIFSRAIADKAMHGAYIASAPNPVPNDEFMRELRRSLRMPIGLPSPAWAVRVGALLFLKTDPELALYGRYCVPRRLHQEGFEFNFPNLAAALDDLIGVAEHRASSHHSPPLG
jgi:uncharacterized protein